jgi:hypothetical protein
MASNGSAKRAAKIGLPILALTALTVGLFMVLLGGTSSVASNTPTMKLFIHASPVGGCTGGNQDWDVSAKVDVTNNSGSDVTIDSTDFTATETDPSGTHAVAVDVTSFGDFQSGATIPDGTTRTFSGIEMTMTLPCDAEHGVVTAHLNLRGFPDEITDSQVFECGGTQIPVGTIGVGGLALLLGLGFWFMQRRKVRQHRIAGMEG